jgi:hypothetical protein
MGAGRGGGDAPKLRRLAPESAATVGRFRLLHDSLGVHPLPNPSPSRAHQGGGFQQRRRQAPLTHSRCERKCVHTLARNRGSRAGFQAFTLDARFRGHDEKSPIAHANFCNEVLVPDLDTFGKRGWVEIPPRTQEYMLLAEFRADPEINPLRTPSGRIELYSEEIARFAYDDCPPHPA